MTNRLGLSAIFKRVAAASAAAALAGSLAIGAPVALAQDFPVAPAAEETVQIYKHDELGSESTEPVGIQLVLAMDTSGSMSDEEFAIELQATAFALNSEIVRNVIKYKAGDQSIAVAVVDFDGTAQVRVPWVDIRAEEINDKPYQPGEDESSAAPDKLDILAEEIRALPRRGQGGTSIETAMDLSEKLYLGSPWMATERRVLDVFGDGTSDNYAMAKSRERLANLGVTINGFAIVNDVSYLEQYFRDNMVTKEFRLGPDGIYSEPGRVWAVARNLQATDNEEPGLKAFFGEVARGMRQKISVELAGVETYKTILITLGEQPDIPVPSPR